MAEAKPAQPAKLEKLAKNLPQTYWSETEHYGLLGMPAKKSLSPLMHNANFEAMGMNAVYFPHDIDEETLSIVMPAFRQLQYRGLNVTMPHKKAVIPYLDEITELGRLCGAINTIRIDGGDGRMSGTNTDATGFVHALKEQGGYDPSGKRCALFGAGGAGRGVSFGLADAGVERIALFDIAPSKPMLDQLVSELNAFKNGVAEGFVIEPDAPQTVAREVRAAGFVVNATSVGMTPNDNATVFDTSLLVPGQMVCDIVYAPYRTKLLREAEERGCKTLKGYWMLLWQGVDAFRFWTDKEPDVATMEEVLVKAVTGA